MDEDEEEGEVEEQMDSMDLLNYGMSMRKSDSLPLPTPYQIPLFLSIIGSFFYGRIMCINLGFLCVF